MRALCYTGLSVWLTWPAITVLGDEVPGAARTDIWNSLWSMWFFQHNFRGGGDVPRTDLINFPDGGILLVADPVNALFAMPLVPLLGLPVTYTVLIFFQLTLAGVCAHTLAEELLLEREGTIPPEAGWIAGVGFASAPILLSGIHNGTSESFSGGWAALAVWLSWRAARFGGARRVVSAVMGLVVASLASWYTGVTSFFFVLALLIATPRQPWRRNLWERLGILLGGCLAVVPFAVLVGWAAEHPENLVRIKNARELTGLRRSTGVADILGYVTAGNFRSPDFRVLSRYGEAFFHCHYLGYILLAGAILSLWRPAAQRQRFLWIAGALGLLLSLGPVLVRNGQPLVLGVERVIPLPYFLIEWMPGFSSLSLLYRLSMAPALALALLAAVGFAGRRYASLVPPAILLEGWLLCPLGALPDTVEVRPAPSLLALRDAPAGAVMNFPVAGGRPYLYEQTIHHKPVTDTINFPNNQTSQRVWSAMLSSAQQEPARFQSVVGNVARREGVRYLVVHHDAEIRPDMHDLAIRAVEAAYTPIAADEDVRVFKLW